MLAGIVYKLLAMGNESSLAIRRAAKGGDARAASLSTERRKAIGKQQSCRTANDFSAKGTVLRAIGRSPNPGSVLTLR